MTPRIEMKWDVKIPQRGGLCLSAILYLPESQPGPAPAIFVMTPYTAQVHHEQGVYFASHGYPFLSVDVQGRGSSEGAFHPLNEAPDGHDIVEWIARQSFCNGKVAMWGGSYMGYCQWATIKEAPPHLATIIPVASPYRGVDSPMRNNLFVPYSMRWLTLLSGHTAQDKMFADQSFWSAQFRRWFESGAPFGQLDTFLGNPSPLFQEWISHPAQDDYWDRHNPTAEQYATLSIHVLTITGSYDGNQAGALAHYRAHMRNASATARARHYLVIGPWDHAGTRSPKRAFAGLKFGTACLLDIPKLHLEWYAWTLQDGPKPPFLRKNVAYYVMGAEQWRYADSLEDVTARIQPLYLGSRGNPTDVFHSGSLDLEPSSAREPDHYVYDPHDVSLAAIEAAADPDRSAVDQRMIHASRGKQLVYHSAPFPEETEISGFFRLTLWMAIDQPDTDFRVSVHEIALDGGSILLGSDSMRARYRECFREEKLVLTADALCYRFERFNFVSRRIEKHHRLRLVIGPVNSIYAQKNYNSGGVVSQESMQDARAVTVKLFHDEARPSALYVPLGQSAEYV
jgi:uncharacterized protein